MTTPHPTGAEHHGFSFGVLGNADHVILRLTLYELLQAGFVPSFVLEDLGTAVMNAKTSWYNEGYRSSGMLPPTVAEMLADTRIAHYRVGSINDEEASACMQNHDVKLFVLANTRIVKPHVLAIPTVTSFNCHAAYLPSNDARHQSPDPAGYLRGALVML